MHRLKEGHFWPGDLVMNLTQIVVKKDCIWGHKMTIVRVKTRNWPQHRVVNDYVEWSQLESDPKMLAKNESI